MFNTKILKRVAFFLACYVHLCADDTHKRPSLDDRQKKYSTSIATLKKDSVVFDDEQPKKYQLIVTGESLDRLKKIIEANKKKFHRLTNAIPTSSEKIGQFSDGISDYQDRLRNLIASMIYRQPMLLMHDLGQQPIRKISPEKKEELPEKFESIAMPWPGSGSNSNSGGSTDSTPASIDTSASKSSGGGINIQSETVKLLLYGVWWAGSKTVNFISDCIEEDRKYKADLKILQDKVARSTAAAAKAAEDAAKAKKELVDHLAQVEKDKNKKSDEYSREKKDKTLDRVVDETVNYEIFDEEFNKKYSHLAINFGEKDADINKAVPIVVMYGSPWFIGGGSILTPILPIVGVVTGVIYTGVTIAKIIKNHKKNNGGGGGGGSDDDDKDKEKKPKDSKDEQKPKGCGDKPGEGTEDSIDLEARGPKEKEKQQKQKAAKEKEESDKKSGGPTDPKKGSSDKQDKLKDEEKIKKIPDWNDAESIKYFEGVKKNSIKDAFHNKFGNLFKDSKTNLWWSKDNGLHGGPHYKVFKETAKGLEHLFNADLLGNEIIGQHKGAVGSFISWKDIRFKP